MRARISAVQSSEWFFQKPIVPGSRVGGTTVIAVAAEAFTVG